MTEQERNTILYLLGESRNPQEIHREAGLKLSDIRFLMREHKDLPALEGWGRRELQPHIISRRGVNDFTWPRKDIACIQEHRRLHDQGKVTMCQGRDGNYILQYAIPTQRALRRAPYFYKAD